MAELQKENLSKYNPETFDVHYCEITQGKANTHLTDEISISTLKCNQENLENNRNIPNKVNTGCLRILLSYINIGLVLLPI